MKAGRLKQRQRVVVSMCDGMGAGGNMCGDDSATELQLKALKC